MSKGYENQLRRKLERAEKEYHALGALRIAENARRVLPVVSAELKAAQDALDDSKERAKRDRTINLDAHKERVKRLKERKADLLRIIKPPKRIEHKQESYYATTTTRILDFDGSDPTARQFGGTIVTLRTRIDVPDSAMADRDSEDRPKREWIRSDVTNEIDHLKARLQWTRDRIADVLTSGSTAQWLLTLPYRDNVNERGTIKSTTNPDSLTQARIEAGKSLEYDRTRPDRIAGWKVD